MITELTDRYVGATLRSIPVKQRADIEAELRASIADAVDARVEGGEDIRSAEEGVLTDLGDPDRLAAGYAGRGGYLIGPDPYFDYRRLLAVLLISVVPVVIAAVAVARVLGGAFFGEVIAESIGTGITVALHVAFWTTLVFAIIEWSGDRSGIPRVESLQAPAHPDRPERESRRVDPDGGVHHVRDLGDLRATDRFPGDRR